MAERQKNFIDRVFDDWLGDPLGTYSQEEAAKNAAQTQAAAADAGIAEQRRQFDISRQILDPYVQAGYEAIGYDTPTQSQAPRQVTFAAGPGGFPMPIPVMGDSQPNGFGGTQQVGGRVKPMMGGAGGGFLGVAMAPGMIGRGVKPTIPSSPSGVNLRTFQSGYEQAQPTLEALTEAGVGAIPQLQDVSRTGMGALNMQAALSGAAGPEAQAEAYAQVESDPAVQYMMDKAREGILSGGSATGNLRAGRTFGALREYQPAILAQAIQDKYRMLDPIARTGVNTAQYLAGTGGNVAQALRSGAQGVTSQLANIGQASAAGQAAGAMQTGTNIANLLAQKGAAEAGGMMAAGTGRAGVMQPIADIGGYIGGKWLGKKLGL